MLIVPADYRIDSGHLPLATLFLAIVCVLVFVLYQSDDDARVGEALAVYAQENLVRHEEPLLAAYLGVDDVTADLIAEAVLDPGFDAHVEAYWQTTDADPAWQASRERFEAARGRISGYRFGLTPAEPLPRAWLAHMFLHGDAGHLIGNLVFLLLFGLLLERLLGSALFFATYVFTGLIAAGVFVLANAGSPVPMIGASGAISGLMGAYLGVYRFRKVRFFYTLGFWFGEFTAPALLVFPLWLGKELYGWFAGADAIAYAAHAGGLLGGAAIAVLLHRQAATLLDTDAKTRRADAERRETLVKIRQLLTDLRIDDALRLAEQSVRQSPGEFAYWQVHAEIAERLPAGQAYARAMSLLFANAGNKAMNVAFLRELLARYQQRDANLLGLRKRGGAAMARRFMREGSVRDADQLLDALHRVGGLSAEFHEVLTALLQFAERNSDRRRAQRYRQYLETIGTAQAVSGPS